MSPFRIWFASFATLLSCFAAVAEEKEVPPRSLDPRIKIELFAESPQIVTPTGIDVDQRGRVWAIESNTHFPPADYKGHSSDRVLVLSDRNGDGRADPPTVFADGLVHTMSINVRPSGAVYIATRKAIYLMHDDTGDDVADRHKRIVYLDTAGDYPHNGLAGFAFDASGWMYFGFGENLGADYKIIGSDKKTLSGGGEGGNIYRCRPDGTQLTRWATGFWNPHANCVDAFGRLFSVDNDPDSRPPCRLLHIIPQGDYGYRFRNGRKGLHPFTAWNGEIPGTLPMVAGTGEAPSGIVAYESDGLPAEYVGSLFVTSWGDHRIDRFRLKPRGTSFTSIAEPLITGGETFRPVGIATAPDGSLYCTDWVSKEYKLHGLGRVWRISAVTPPKREMIDVAGLSQRSVQELKTLVDSPRLEVRRAAADRLKESGPGRDFLFACLDDPARSSRAKVEALWALMAKPLHFADVKTIINKKFWTSLDEVSTAGIWLIGTSPEAWLTEFPHPSNPGGDPTHLLASLNFISQSQPTLIFHPDEKQLAELVQVALKASQHAAADPFVFALRVQVLARIYKRELFADLLKQDDADPNAAYRCSHIEALLAARQQDPKSGDSVRLGLADPDFAVRRAAVQWAAEERLVEFKPQIEATLSGGPITNDLFLATLAGLELLSGVNPVAIDQTPASQYALAIVRDAKRSPGLRAQALRIVSPSDAALDAALLRNLLASDDPALKLEAIRTLQTSPLPEAADLLHAVAADEKLPVELRAEAIVGLAPLIKKSAPGDPHRKLLEQFLASTDLVLKVESLRALRGLSTQDEKVRAAVLELAGRLTAASKSSFLAHEMADQLAMTLGADADKLPAQVTAMRTRRPAGRAEWLQTLSDAGGSVALGRSAFYHVNGAGCSKCHTVNGRGGRVGPDLTTYARTATRDKLIDSILDPSRDIAPQFVSWSLEMKSGKVHSGLILTEDQAGLTLGNAEGE